MSIIFTKNFIIKDLFPFISEDKYITHFSSQGIGAPVMLIPYLSIR